jgi:hypothetical protein
MKESRKMKILSRTVDFGPFDWNGNGKKDHKVQLAVCLKLPKIGPILSICGSVWDENGELICGGQCLDEIFRHPQAMPWIRLHRLWKKWHLNDMTPGSPRQEAAIAAWELSNKYSYDAACAMLKRIGLYEDEQYKVDGKPYVYGTDWLYRPIDRKDLAEIRKWINGKEKIK